MYISSCPAVSRGWSARWQKLLQEPEDPSDYPYWSVALMGPLTYIAAMIHAGSWKGVSKAIGATAAFLSVIYITALGSITVSVGIKIYRIDHKDMPLYYNSVPSWMKLQFSGGVISCFFWAIVLMLWPWYSHTYTVISTDVETQPLITTSRKSVHQCWVIWFDTFLTWHILSPFLYTHTCIMQTRVDVPCIIICTAFNGHPNLNWE